MFLLATLGVYRVLGCSGSSNDDVILAALERAVTDGMDIINLSLGEPNGWPNNPVARAISKVKSFGIMVTVSTGNENTQGLFSANYIGEGSSVLAVASYINTRELLNYFTLPSLPNYRFCKCSILPTPLFLLLSTSLFFVLFWNSSCYHSTDCLSSYL
jgi:subtilisin family serine protease